MPVSKARTIQAGSLNSSNQHVREDAADDVFIKQGEVEASFAPLPGGAGDSSRFFLTNIEL